MKYWNKDKEIRKRCWTKVTLLPSRAVVAPKIGSFHRQVTWYGYPDRSEVKRWCQQQQSSGKFYNYFASDTWFFEKPEDATLFLLRWG